MTKNKCSRDYPSSLTNEEWAVLEKRLPQRSKVGRPPKYEYRDIVDAILYVLVEGIRWRSLPHDFPVWDSVYGYFRSWRNAGVWEQLHQALYVEMREHEGRATSPSVGCLDSQSIKGHNKGVRGFDGGKGIKGRKRHMLVDTLGLLVAVSVTAANVGDRAGAKHLVANLKARLPRFQLLLADGGYTGDAFACWLATSLGWLIEISINLGAGFIPIPKR